MKMDFWHSLIHHHPADAAAKNYWQSHDFYTILNSSTARNIFISAFLILNISIGLVGALLLKHRNQAKLLKGKNRAISLNCLSSWMTAAEVVSYIWQTRRLPGGYYGLFMLSTGTFGILHQYFVSSFITAATGLYGNCAFSKGVVIQPLFDGVGPEGTITPARPWPAANVAISAQIAAIRHGDSPGIYAKANSDSDFTITTASPDYLGSWTCNSSSGPMSFESVASVQSIASDLIRKDLMYTNWLSHTGSGNGSDTRHSGLLLWSPSVASDVRQSWAVKAAISPFKDLGQPTMVYNFDCTMAGERIQWILKKMPSVGTLDGWGQSVYASLVYGNDIVSPGDETTFGSTLEVFLNAMVMAAGSGNNATHVLTKESKASYKSTDIYRCAIRRTIIPLPVWIVLALLSVNLVIFIFADLILLILISGREKRKEVKDIPSDISSWQVAFLRDRFPRRQPTITATGMSSYTYGWNGEFEYLQFKSIEN
ncbi:MAG: hypothetical protein Q9187_008561, partial [Circinaria calcarea]